MASGDLVTRAYGNFRGVDFRGEEINLMRSPDSLNMWKDYKETESIRTRPGMKLLSIVDAEGNKIFGSGKYIYGIFFYNDIMLVHYNTVLYKVVNGVASEIYSFANPMKSEAFIFNNLWYFKDGANYLQYDGEIVRNVEDVAYVPTTTLGRKAGLISGGTVAEDVNMLSPYRINTFVGDGESRLFYLDVPEIDVSTNPLFAIGDIQEFLLNITINGKPIYEKVTDEKGKVTLEYVIHTLEDGTQTTYDVAVYKNGGIIHLGTTEAESVDFEGSLDNKIRIFPAPPAPLTDGQDNVSIKFKKSNNANKILNCTLLQVFDNRVFFSGNKDYPNMMWHCSLNDPTYCSDLDYYNEGLDTAKVKGMVAGNNALWVFKEPSQANTTVFYHTPTIDVEYGKIYPNAHSSIATGCVGKAINFNDDIVFFSDRGMEGISGDITSEQVIAHRSTFVDRKLITEPNYTDMFLEEWNGYLLIFVGKTVYLADSRAMFPNENHTEYEWFYWEFEKAITCARVHNGTLYLGVEDGIYTLTDTTGDVESYWITPKDKFNHPQYLKTTNKRGCTIEATGDITVYAKTEKDQAFNEENKIGTYANVEDYFVCRIKRKKWKDIQLKFYSNTRFSLETASLESFIGGYIKR